MIRTGIDTQEYRRLLGEVDKELIKLNNYRDSAKKIVPELPSGIEQIKEAVIKHIRKGFPKDTVLSYCAEAKGLKNNFHDFISNYNDCQKLEHIEYLILDDDRYTFSDSVDEQLIKKAGQYIEGEFAQELLDMATNFLNSFDTLYKLSHNKVESYPASLPMALGLFRVNDDLTLSVNHIGLQEVLNNLSDTDKELLKTTNNNV